MDYDSIMSRYTSILKDYYPSCWPDISYVIRISALDNKEKEDNGFLLSRTPKNVSTFNANHLRDVIPNFRYIY